MIRNRALRMFAAALAASLVAVVAVAALGFLLVMSLMVVAMPRTEWSGIFLCALLLIIFGVTFIVCFREMMDKLGPQ